MSFFHIFFCFFFICVSSNALVNNDDMLDLHDEIQEFGNSARYLFPNQADLNDFDDDLKMLDDIRQIRTTGDFSDLRNLEGVERELFIGAIFKAIKVGVKVVKAGIKIAKKVKKGVKNVKSVVNKVKRVVNKGKQIYNKGKRIYNKGKQIYNKGKKIYNKGKRTYNKAKSVYNQVKGNQNQQRKNRLADIEDVLNSELLSDDDLLDSIEGN